MKCGGYVRPSAVWFGENLDPAVVREASRQIAECDLLLIVGMSGVVYPAAGMVQRAPAYAVIVEINPKPGDAAARVGYRWRTTAARGLPALLSTHNGYGTVDASTVLRTLTQRKSGQMSLRAMLRNQVIAAWKNTINGPYCDQLINSERGLQVYFCAALLRMFETDGVHERRRLFIEPRLSASEGSAKRVYPDVVICNTRQVIGIIELKYAPRAAPDSTKDLNSFVFGVLEREHLTISNDRYRGASKNPSAKLYPLAEDCLLCWAGVYNQQEPLDLRQKLLSDSDLGNQELNEARRKDIVKRFLQLDALTLDGEHPDIHIDMRIPKDDPSVGPSGDVENC